jgi:lipopolysaccharide export system permease protein
MLKEMLVPAIVGALLVLLMLVGNVLYALLYQMYEFRATAGEVGRLLWYQIPGLTMQAVPAAMLLGAALALNRLVREREVLAMRMTGARVVRLIMPFLVLGVAFSGLLFYLQERVIPQTTREATKLFAQIQWRRPIMVVQQDVVYRVQEKILYVKEVDARNKVLRDVYMVEPLGGGRVRIMTVPLAYYEGNVWVVRGNPAANARPQAWEFDAKGEMTRILEPEDGMLNIQQTASDFLINPPSKPEELTIPELLAIRNSFRGSAPTYGINRVRLEPQQLTFYLHRKFAAPLAALVAVLIAVPLAIRFGRQGFVGLLVAAVGAFLFVVMQQWAQVLAVKSEPLLHPIIAAWAPGGFFALVGLVLLFFEE